MSDIPLFFAVRNFEKFQHYTDRRPPWIKLYRDLWDDPRFFELSEVNRYLLVGVFVLASQHENRVSTKQKWLKAQLLTSKHIPLETFIAAAWIGYLEQDASIALAKPIMLAECYPSRACGETEVQKYRDRSTETDGAPLPELIIGFGEYGRARMTQAEHDKLKEKLNGQLDNYIDRFDRWVEEAPEVKSSGVKRKDKKAYLSIRNWSDKDGNGSNRKVGVSVSELNDRICKEFLDNKLAQAVRGDIPDVRQDLSGLPGKA